MKYELEPENRNCTDDALLEDIRATALRLNKLSLTKEDYDKHGRFCAATMQNRFGSWNKTLEQSGLIVQKRNNIPHDELLLDLKRVAEILGSENVLRESYRTLGNFSDATVARTFGSWANALIAAGLNISPGWKPKAKEDELFSNMAAVWEKVGRQPKRNDFHPPTSLFSADSYVRRFGSWRKALEAFVAVANGDDVHQCNNVEAVTQETVVVLLNQRERRMPRDPSWRLRFLVNRRDRFACRACGRSPSVEPGVILHVDHIKAWSKGGETTMENLQTLCQRCNIGKSDLAMNEDGG